MPTLSHYDKRGKARMVDVTEKSKNPKGDPLETARIAGISAAKRTSEWIPLCHPLPLTYIDVHPRVCKNGVEIRTQVTAAAQTGVEMEALVAAAAAALTVYDMCKALDKGIEVSELFLVEKTGGKSGDYHRPIREGTGRRRKNQKGSKGTSFSAKHS